MEATNIYSPLKLAIPYNAACPTFSQILMDDKSRKNWEKTVFCTYSNIYQGAPFLPLWNTQKTHKQAAFVHNKLEIILIDCSI